MMNCHTGTTYDEYDDEVKTWRWPVTSVIFLFCRDSLIGADTGGLILSNQRQLVSHDQKNFFGEENCFHFSRILSISIFELRTKIFLSEDKFSISASWQPGQPWHESRIQLRRKDDHRPGGREVQRVRQPHDHQRGGEQAGDCCHRKAKVSTRANFQKIQVLSGLDVPFVK